MADAMVALLKSSGVRRVYGIPGDSLNGAGTGTVFWLFTKIWR